MTLATLIIDGRWWYDWLTIAWVVGFFLIEMVLLFRNSLLGWAMTAKCLTLAGVFFWSLQHPPPVLLPEEVTLETVTVRGTLIVVLGVVIVILLYMRLKRLTVVVGRAGDEPAL